MTIGYSQISFIYYADFSLKNLLWKISDSSRMRRSSIKSGASA